VKERYPRFVDALSDLDDALAITYLFAALPSEGRITPKVTAKAQELSAAWSVYCTTTSAITKTFISVKGVYLEADIQHSTIRWIVPHSFTQNLPKDVDYRVMLTFFEFYEALLTFVLYKLYNDIGVRYPLVTATTVGSLAQISSNCITGKNLSSIVTAHLRTLSSKDTKPAEKGTITSVVSDATMQNSNSTNTKSKRQAKNAVISIDAALSKLVDDYSSDDDDVVEDEESCDGDESGTDEEGGNANVVEPLKAALDNLAREQEASIIGGGATMAKLSEEAIKRKRLFSGLVFFLSREVPRGYLELVCLSYGGTVGWEGDDSPIGIRDKSITHHLVDRKTLPDVSSLPKHREYVQPQWVVDCANFHFLLPCSRYGIGKELPPHLSPFVNDEEEGYKPKYAEEIERLKNGEEICDMMHVEASVSSQCEEEPHIVEENTDSVIEPMEEAEENNHEESEEEEEEEEVNNMNDYVKMKHDNEAKELAKLMMSKKAVRLYGRMQHGLAQKQEKIANLERKRKDIELNKIEQRLLQKREEIKGTKGKTADGKSKNQAKVERLKKERRAIENDYSKSGGSMTKKRKND
jgi:pescadillo protein